MRRIDITCRSRVSRRGSCGKICSESLNSTGSSFRKTLPGHNKDIRVLSEEGRSVRVESCPSRVSHRGPCEEMYSESLNSTGSSFRKTLPGHNKDIKVLSEEGRSVRVELGSGIYQFKTKL